MTISRLGVVAVALCAAAANGEEFTIRRAAGVPRIAIDGVPVAGTAAMPWIGHRPGESTESLRPFHDIAGIRFASDVWMVNSSNYPARHWWLDEGVYDWDLFDRLVTGLTSASTNAYIFPRIKIDPPPKWFDAHPEELYTSRGKMLIVRPDSSAWRALYRRMLRDMVAHVDASDYSGRVMGYHIGALSCGEWIVSPLAKTNFPSFRGALVDTHDPLPPYAISSERRKAIDDLTSSVADAVIDSAECMRGLVGRRKLIGSFFGYLGLSHEKMRRVFDSGLIDFFASPPFYGSARDAGNAGVSQMMYPASLRLNGYVYFEETDYRTFLSDRHFMPLTMVRPRPLSEAVNIVRRSIGRVLAEGYENWWFLLGGPETFSHPMLMESIRTGAEIERRTLLTAQWEPAEVAVFTSADEYATSRMAMAYSNEFMNACTRSVFVNELPKCGVPYDSYELGDIANPNLPDYKAYFFPNAFTLTDSQRESIKARVRRRGKTAIWVYAPGYFRDSVGNVGNIADITGVEVRECYPVDSAICTRRFVPKGATTIEKDGWRGLYLPMPPDAAVLREAFRRAGAHVWMETGDVLSAGRGFLMCHASSDGEKLIRLPGACDVTEVFGASMPRRGVTELSEKMAFGETRVFALRPAPSSGVSLCTAK